MTESCSDTYSVITADTAAGVSIALHVPVSPLTPVESSDLVTDTATFSVSLEDADEGVMVGRSTKVYATSEVGSREELLQTYSRSTTDMEPPEPTEIPMASLSPRQDDRQDPSETLNRTLHQVSC